MSSLPKGARAKKPSKKLKRISMASEDRTVQPISSEDYNRLQNEWEARYGKK